ncbi:MAG: hypothetical protein FWD55_08985 [Propionibacteriaceae bacterium]|nr:hypothetical protein [Propionibacteriaceae bacterium]
MSGLLSGVDRTRLVGSAYVKPFASLTKLIGFDELFPLLATVEERALCRAHLALPRRLVMSSRDNGGDR